MSTALATTAFYDRAQPALSAQDYQIAVEQTVIVDGVAEPSYGAVQRLRITGPHLGLDPSDVLATSPATGAQGSFDTWLPHVVLAHRTLPWQIDATATGAAAAPAGTPWLALLLLTPTEIDVAGSPPAPGTTGTQTVALNGLLNPPAGTVGPTATSALTIAMGDQASGPVTVVDVDLAAFQAVAPQVEELPLLTHVRQVDTADQEDLGVAVPGWYSVVVGNRLPVGSTDGCYVAHLVSVEGTLGLLPGGGTTTSATRVRLVSLFSWCFASTADTADFVALAEGLDLDPLTVPVTVSGTDPAHLAVADAIDAGYTALRYQTRLGEETTAWYRGPFTPQPIEANPQPAYPAPAAALIYDPATGMFDTAYAAAWELGRLLTLANAPVTIALAGLSAGAVSAQRQLVRAAVPGADPAESPRAGAARVLAATVAPSVHNAGARPSVLGASGDRHGLNGVALPGLLDPAELRRLYDEGPDAYRRVRDVVLGRSTPSESSDGSRRT